MKVFKLGFLCLLFGVVIAGRAAQATTINFSGGGASGTIPPGALPWVVTPDDQNVDSFLRAVSTWGTPGLGTGSNTWPTGNGDAIAFTITFTGLPTGVTIDQTPDSNPTGFTDFTRFHSNGDSVVWTPTYSGGDSVTFTAPVGFDLPPGTEFYTNVAFSGGTVSGVQFTGDWTTTAEVPEPATLPLLGFGLMALWSRYSARRSPV